MVYVVLLKQYDLDFHEIIVIQFKVVYQRVPSPKKMTKLLNKGASIQSKELNFVKK